MGIVAKDNSADFVLAPEGQFVAVCCDVIDWGIVETTWKGRTKKRHRIKIVYQLAETDDGKGKPFEAGSYFTLTLAETGALRPYLESWRGKAFTPDELKDGFDVEKLIGANAVITILHETKNGKTYANIKSIMRPMKGMEKVEVTPGYVRYKDRAENAAPDGARPVEDDDDEEMPF